MAVAALFLASLPLWTTIPRQGWFFLPVIVIALAISAVVSIRGVRNLPPTRIEVLAEAAAKDADPRTLKKVKVITSVAIAALLGLAFASVIFEVGPGRAIVRLQDRLIGGHFVFASTLLVFFLELAVILGVARTLSFILRRTTGMSPREAWRKATGL